MNAHAAWRALVAPGTDTPLQSRIGIAEGCLHEPLWLLQQLKLLVLGVCVRRSLRQRNMDDCTLHCGFQMLHEVHAFDFGSF